jgi:hypothetical protein
MSKIPRDRAVDADHATQPIYHRAAPHGLPEMPATTSSAIAETRCPQMLVASYISLTKALAKPCSRERNMNLSIRSGAWQLKRARKVNGRQWISPVASRD